MQLITKKEVNINASLIARLLDCFAMCEQSKRLICVDYEVKTPHISENGFITMETKHFHRYEYLSILWILNFMDSIQEINGRIINFYRADEGRVQGTYENPSDEYYNYYYLFGREL